MIEFPDSTRVGRRIPKEAFYRNLPISASLKAKFVSDVEKITIENSLQNKSLNLVKKAEIKEIMLLSVLLKKKNFDGKILEAIAKQNPHKLVFLLVYEDQRQLAIYHRKLYKTDWAREDELELKLNSDNLDDIWDDLVRQIAIHSEELLEGTDKTVDEQLRNQDEIDRLEEKIVKTEKAARREVQRKKKFELFEKLKGYKKELEEIKNGQA